MHRQMVLPTLMHAVTNCRTTATPGSIQHPGVAVFVDHDAMEDTMSNQTQEIDTIPHPDQLGPADVLAYWFADEVELEDD